MANKESNKNKDLILVKRAKSGDYRAFDLLVLKYQSRIIGIVMKYVKDIQIAEDVAQETFLKAYKSLDSFREESAFYTWIYRIAANTAKNYLTSKKRKKEYSETELQTSTEQPNLFDIPGGDSPEEILAANNLREVILESLSSLTEDIRTAISLREFENLSYEEIAEVLNCPIGTVRSRIFRGREIIQEKISPLVSENLKFNKGSKVI
tara:strand:+ start:240 stop:863 length:624 start_codon:yes stop_codon:yes gene_type:complete